MGLASPFVRRSLAATSASAEPASLSERIPASQPHRFEFSIQLLELFRGENFCDLLTYEVDVTVNLWQDLAHDRVGTFAPGSENRFDLRPLAGGHVDPFER